MCHGEDDAHQTSDVAAGNRQDGALGEAQIHGFFPQFDGMSDIEVGLHGALGAAGGAGGVEQNGGVFLPGAGQRQPGVGASEQILEGAGSFGVASRREQCDQIFGGAAVVQPLHQVGFGDSHFGRAIGKNIAEPGALFTGVQRDRDGAEPERAIKAVHQRRAVAQHQRHPVPGTHAKFMEGGGDPRGPPCQLAVADAFALDHEGIAVGIAFQGGLQHGLHRDWPLLEAANDTAAEVRFVMHVEAIGGMVHAALLTPLPTSRGECHPAPACRRWNR